MKKVLSIVLTLALLLTALPLALGMTASAAGTGDYAIYFDNSSNGNNFWVTKKNDDHPELGMEELNLPAGNTYTVEFDVYALTAGSNVVFGATKATWSTTTAIENGHQVWKNAPATTNTWTHYSFNVNTTETWNGVIFYVTGDGFKGYIDNLTIKDSTGNVAASFEPTADDLSKTSNCAKNVELSACLVDAKTPKVKDYAINFDNSAGTGFTAFHFSDLGFGAANLPIGNYTVKFDFYALEIGASKNIVAHMSNTAYNGNAFPGNAGQYWTEVSGATGKWETISFTVETIDVASYPWFYIGAGLKGYMDNFKVIDNATNTEVVNFEISSANFGKVSKNFATVVELPADVEAAKYPPYHKNTKEDVVDATYFTEGSKTVTCTDCGEVVSTEVIPAASDALVNGFATKYENGKFVIEFEYTDALMMDIIDGAVITFNYTVNGYTNAVVLDGDEGATVTLEGFNADRLTADLTYYLSAEYAGVDTAKINNVKETVKAADKANDESLAELLDALKADDANTVVNGKASNTEWLVSNTIKLDIKAATAELNIAASQKLVDTLTTLGKEGRTVTLTVKVGDNFTKDVVITDLRKYTIVKIAGLSFEQLNGDISVKLAFDYEGDANDFATEEISFACGDYIYNAGTPVADAFANYLSA